MGKVIFEGIEVAEALCRLTWNLSIRRIDLYDAKKHKFLNPELKPNTSEIEQIRKKYEEINQFPPYNFTNVLSTIIQQTSIEPPCISLDSVRTAVGDKEATLTELQHVVFYEDEGERVTDTIYLGENRFFVLSTSRSTIIPGDILVPNTVPLCVGEEELFTLFRNGKEFQPQEFAGYSTPFRTHPLKRIIHKTTPDIYDIIDHDDRFGNGKLASPKAKTPEERLLLLIEKIKSHINKYRKEISTKNQPFPEYDLILAEAKSLGVSCYILNLLIETFDRGSKIQYSFIEEDWKLPPSLIEAREKARKKKLQTDYTNLKKSFEKEVAKVRTRRVGLFFKAAGRFENIGLIQELEKKLELLADQGYGDHKWAEARRNEAIANSKPGQWENLVTAVKLVVAITIIAFAGLTWFQTKQGLEIFNLKIEQADSKVATKEYNEAKELYMKAYEEYQPRITLMLVSGTYKDRIKTLKQTIDDEIQQGIEDLNILLTADGGRFSDHTQRMLSDLLELDPQNEDLLALREICINQ